MRGSRHWFNHHSGLWPFAACGFQIDDELGDDYTLWMSRVSCLDCQLAVQAEIEALAPPRPTFALHAMPLLAYLSTAPSSESPRP